MSNLLVARGRIFTSIKKIKTYALNIPATYTISHIETRLAKLEEYWSEFKDVEDQILSEDPTIVSKCDEFQDIYFDTTAMLRELLIKKGVELNPKPAATGTGELDRFLEQQRRLLENISVQTQAISDNSISHSTEGVRLPKINIDIFDGDYSKWPSFQDLYLSTVHTRLSLSSCQKFQLLRGLLRGEPASLVRHLLVTDANYEQAWEKLRQRYDKKKPILKSLITSYIDQPSVTIGSPEALRNLYNKSDEIIRGIKALGRDAETRDPWLIHLLLRKIDVEAQELWASRTLNENFPTIEQFLEFLDERCETKESTIQFQKRHTRSGTQVRSHYSSASSSNSNACPCCKHIHNLSRCFKFKKMPVSIRRTLVNEYDVCYNCLRKDHSVKDCPSLNSCFHCQQRHNTLLHLEPSSTQYNQESPSTITKSNPSTNTAFVSNMPSVSTQNNQESSSITTNPNTSANTASVSTMHIQNQSTHLQLKLNDHKSNINQNSQLDTTQSFNISAARFGLLPTTLINVRDNAGQNILARALLDSGSQSSFVKESLVHKLRLPRSYACVTVTGLAESKAVTTKGMVQLTLRSRHNNLNQQIRVDALILPKITSTVPPAKVDFSTWCKLKNLALADTNFNSPSDIDILLGADIFFQLLEPQQKKIEQNLTAQLTKFGWILAGTILENKQEVQSYSALLSNDAIDHKLEAFWKLEDVPIVSAISQPEQVCEEHYKQTTYRNESGRYVVKLPFSENTNVLGDSKTPAYSRLFAMERKFKRNPDLYSQYHKFMQEYIDLGHMSEIPSELIPCNDKDSFYLPHHAVFKEDGLKSKLRVVFDGSCASSSGTSLNDNLLVGPTIQKDLACILLRFRQHRYVFTADVEKMYRQVVLNASDRNFQRILWRSNKDEPIQHFQLNTVTYGLSCAPFLAVRTLQQIGYDCVSPNSKIRSIIDNDFYIDDLLTGCEGIDEAQQTQQELTEILASAGFNLRKWKANSPLLLNSINTMNEPGPHNFEELDFKTLGLQWNQEKDTFSFYSKSVNSTVSTKRELLSEISRIFDPLGLISPIIIVFKILLQKLWIRKLNWDDILPTDIITQWKYLQQTLCTLQDINIPRYIMTSCENISTEMHGFCDSSESAYAAAIYIRTTTKSGAINVHLVTSKTRVAPLKQVSLPRLELCGAVLLSKLIRFVASNLQISITRTYAWTDSQIVLSWLSDHPRRWKSFVANRTSHILDSVPFACWKHIASRENPADIATRGCNPITLKDSELWWSGPHWLQYTQSKWPQPRTLTPIKIQEERKCSIVSTPTYIKCDVLQDLFLKVSSFSKIKRILCYIYKIHKHYRKLDWIDLIKRAEITCIKWAQQECFSSEIKMLADKSEIHPKSKIRSLSPFIDNEGVLRVGGRLSNSDAAFNIKHPIILPKGNILSKMIISEEHIRHLHPGPTLLTSLLRQKYWIIDCRNMVRHHYHKCVICYRQAATTSTQLMGDLPKSRITESRPFLHTGVDYAGPIYIKARNGRGQIPVTKGYICIFVCFSVKAIHIELATDMSSECFIAALRRFISRRGIPEEIISDNGSNFIGAKREISELYKLFLSDSHKLLINNFLSQNEIKFTFSPPKGPHFGGIWESNIKAIKHHLNRVTYNSRMTYEEMITLLTQIEALLNSRPLCPISIEVDDFSVLTPSHFLIGEPLLAIPEPSLLDVSANRLSKWQNVQVRMQGFWKRWHVEYLHNLQQRPKWCSKQENYAVNDLVLIKDSNLPPAKWLLGRIIAVYPGADGLVRVVTVKTNTGEFKRPIVQLCKLPMDV